MAFEVNGPDSDELTDRESRIRARAYEIWQGAGEQGDADDHWRQAEAEIEAEERASGVPGGPANGPSYADGESTGTLETGGSGKSPIGVESGGARGTGGGKDRRRQAAG